MKGNEERSNSAGRRTGQPGTGDPAGSRFSPQRPRSCCPGAVARSRLRSRTSRRRPRAAPPPAPTAPAARPVPARRRARRNCSGTCSATPVACAPTAYPTSPTQAPAAASCFRQALESIPHRPRSRRRTRSARSSCPLAAPAPRLDHAPFRAVARAHGEGRPVHAPARHLRLPRPQDLRPVQPLPGRLPRRRDLRYRGSDPRLPGNARHAVAGVHARGCSVRVPTPQPLIGIRVGSS
jgi:hypothetical protein